eukprot:CAMPEP_0170590826 /NCGR_PEP_ID=MMETSP0224-20130122/12076_1 /TAXON_ID=285029 /ORGANISM="Togula jolla, Strain CCCM 725" /LENGTH=386 /DNA_ID=CAMNT_0010914647 /DNA_START=55 /DNA_END=1215 /DNA_ORIENTATION=+
MFPAARNCSPTARSVLAFFLSCALVNASDDIVLLQLRATVEAGSPASILAKPNEIRFPVAAANNSIQSQGSLAGEEGTGLPPILSRNVSVELAAKEAAHNFLGTPARTLIVDGCSGSSYMMALSWRLMRAHGEFPWPLGEGGSHKEDLIHKMFHVLSPAEKKSMRQLDMTSALEMAMIAVSNRTNSSIFFKTNTRIEGWLPFFSARAKFMKRNGVKSALIFRRNLLDWNVCRVRDCFDEGHNGIPVDKNGKRDRTCFMRRWSRRVTRARLNPEQIAKKLVEDAKERAETLELLRKEGLADEVIYSEDLMSFERGSRGFMKSIKSWTKVLSKLGIQPSRAIIADVLAKEPTAGKLPEHEQPHSEVIDNLEEVAPLLVENGLGHYLRI